MEGPLLDTLADTLSLIVAEPDTIIETTMHARHSSWLTWLILLAVLVLFFLMIFLGYRMGKRKGLGLVGLCLGGALGVIGLLIICALPSKIKTCAYCQREIPINSNFCPYCGKPLS